MKKTLILSVLAVAIVLFSGVIGFADTSFRCGNKLVDIGDNMYFIRQVCGDPISEQRVGERTAYWILPGENLKVKDETYLVEWVYAKDSGYYILTFEGSRLLKKEYSR